MKKIAFIVLISFLALTSCTKDENTTFSKTNQFDYNGFTIELGNTGTLSFYPSDVFMLNLYSSSITLNENTGSFIGVGDFIFFVLYIPGSSDIIEGRYEYSTENIDNIMFQGQIGFGFNGYDLNDHYEKYDVTSGYIDLKYNETKEIYTINFDVVVANGKRVKGNFTGSIQNIVGTKK